jgi:SIR2-like protein
VERWMMSLGGTANSGKPKLLVILGAGSSIPCGMPSVSDINEQMKAWSRECKPTAEPAGGAGTGVFNDLWEIVEGYYRSNHYGIGANYERVLSEMTALASWLTPSPFGNALRAAVQDGAPVSAFAFPPEGTEQNSYRNLIVGQQGFLLGKLAEYMRECGRLLDTESSPFAAYRNILLMLREKFDLGIYNLNYDNVARSAWPEAFNGFNHGFFEPRCISRRNEWEFIYHLHGSVHHSIASPHNSSLVWRDDLTGQFLDHQPLAPDMAQDFRPIPLTTLIAGGFKLDQILADPYQTFYAALVRHVHEADAILIAGYGFGDLHVNRVLRNRFECTANDVALPPVVVLEKSDPTKLQTASLQSHNLWAYQLTHTFNTKFHTTKQHLNRQLTVVPFLQQHEFENSLLNRVAIWHGGFIEALGSFDKIANRLHCR